MMRSQLFRFLAYACVGATGTAVQYGILFALVSKGTPGPVPASRIGGAAGAVVNYILNYKLTLRSSDSHRNIAPRFFAVAGAGVALNSLFMFLLVHRLSMPYLLAQCVATACVLVTTFVVNSIWAFKTPPRVESSTSPPEIRQWQK